MLTQEESAYYSRQLLLSDFGSAAQEKLKNSHVVVIGAGGLGCPALLYLAGAGVENITIADGDVVQESNLHRQVLYTIEDLGMKKTEAAANRLHKLNPHIHITCIYERVKEENVSQIIHTPDVVIDATDNFETRFILGDYTSRNKIPLVFAAISGFEGQLTVFNYKSGSKFRDLFPSIPSNAAIPDCSINGVIGFVPGVLGTFQAAEALKIITGIGTVMSGKLMVMDLLSMNKREFIIKHKRVDSRSKNLNRKDDSFKNTEKMIKEINTSELKNRLNDNTDDIFLLDVREPHEFNQFNIGGTLIPLGELKEKINILPDNKEIVVVCKSGVRSMRAAQFIAEKKKDVHVFNLKGGLVAWVTEELK